MSTDQSWRKSTRSNAQSSCVELKVSAAVTGIRDTKNRAGGSLTFAADKFAAFRADVKAGRFDAN